VQVTLRATVDPGAHRVEVRAASGHALLFDLAPPQGEGVGPSPMQSVLAALAACTAMDVASILRKKRQRAEGYEIALEAERAAEHPRVFTRIVVEHRVQGQVEPEALRRAVELSATRYCPVNAMLAGAVEIEHRYLLALGDGPDLRSVVAVIGPADRSS
jgi:putative redox protein